MCSLYKQYVTTTYRPPLVFFSLIGAMLHMLYNQALIFNTYTKQTYFTSMPSVSISRKNIS